MRTEGPGPRERRAARLYYAEGKSQREAAEELGISQSTVSRMLRRPAVQAYVDRLTEEATRDTARIVKLASLRAARREIELLLSENPTACLAACRDLLDRAGLKTLGDQRVRVELEGCEIGMIGEVEEHADTPELPADGYAAYFHGV